MLSESISLSLYIKGELVLDYKPTAPPTAYKKNKTPTPTKMGALPTFKYYYTQLVTDKIKVISSSSLGNYKCPFCKRKYYPRSIDLLKHAAVILGEETKGDMTSEKRKDRIKLNTQQ
jgi:hypothetical protein